MRTGRQQLSQSQAAYLFLMPFFAVYVIFLVYPFFRGFWISLHDWNLLAVAFNPDAKEFVGFKNYQKTFWGKNMSWGITARPMLQFSAVLVFAGVTLLSALKLISRPTFVSIALAAVAFFILPGFEPDEGGRWFDRRFWPTVGRTIEFVVLTVPSVTILSLVLAAAMNRETRAMGILRTIFFLSTVLSVTVVTLIWLIIFSPFQGIIANVSELVGGPRVAWLTSETLAMPALVIATVWWSIGISMILFLAGLQDINPSIYEAAALDNAKGPKAFWYITLPNLKRTITLVVVLQIIAHFQIFGQPHLMTNGGPNDRTQTLVRHIYQTGFRDSELGEAAAMAMFLFLIMGAFSILQFVIGRDSE